MRNLWNKIARFLGEQDGPTAVEYAFLLVLILLAVLTAITVLGQATANSLDNSCQSIDSAIGNS